uniref:Uncharacterized protein n=1 Tax=viral metagenome TaxID=1070528 RepID=A0A6H1ZA90_9ZZZZ
MKTKEQKRMEAEERQEIYDGFSDKQKLRKLNKGGFVATKERKRRKFPELS